MKQKNELSLSLTASSLFTLSTAGDKARRSSSCSYSTVASSAFISGDDNYSHSDNSSSNSNSNSILILDSETTTRSAHKNENESNIINTERTSKLLRLINEPTSVDWTAVLHRLRSHPSEAFSDVDEQGTNALHAACYRYASPDIIRAILDAAPGTASQSRKTGELPLHVACYTSTEDCQDSILNANPEAASVQDSYGDCPLHYAVRHGASLEILEKLIMASPETIAFENAQGMTPFSELCRSYCDADSFQEILEDEDNGFYHQDWETMALLLRASYFSQHDDPLPQGLMDSSCGDWIVHAAAATPSCPNEILRCLCRFFPEQSRKRNSRGMTPLLLAVQARNVVKQETTDSRTQSKHLEEQSYRAERHDKEQTETHVSILLEWDRYAAKIPDPNGVLPLSNALISGKPWDSVVYPLFEAHPIAIEAVSKTGLPMFLLAALHSPSLDAVYGIVRMDPNFHGAIKDMQYAAAVDEELNRCLFVSCRGTNGRRRRLL